MVSASILPLTPYEASPHLIQLTSLVVHIIISHTMTCELIHPEMRQFSQNRKGLHNRALLMARTHMHRHQQLPRAQILRLHASSSLINNHISLCEVYHADSYRMDYFVVIHACSLSKGQYSSSVEASMTCGGR